VDSKYKPFTIDIDIFLLDWRQVLSYDVSFLNIRIVVNFVINLVDNNLPRTALQMLCFISIKILRLLFLMRQLFKKCNNLGAVFS
jgi:hypothetical protein